MDFNILDDDETEMVVGRTEPAEVENFMLEPPSASMNAVHDLPESSSPGKIELTTKKFLTKSTRRRETENAARVPFLGTLP